MNNGEDTKQKDRECKTVIDKKDYYDILGVKKEADEDEIRKAYKKMAIKFHPDKNNSKLAADAFKKVSHAFTVLSNKEKKKNYDMFGDEEGMGMTGGRGGHFQGDDVDPFDLFNMFFNNSMSRGFPGFEGGQRGGGSTEYIFRNGNVEYKVYSSGGGSFMNMNMGGFFNENGEDDDDGSDILEQFLFGGRGRRRNNRQAQDNGRSARGHNHSNSQNSHQRHERAQREAQRRREINNRYWTQILQMIPLLFLTLFVISPYILRKFY